MESLVLAPAIAVEGTCRAIIDAGAVPAGIQPIPVDIAAE
jgi:hypothetical protein